MSGLDDEQDIVILREEKEEISDTAEDFALVLDHELRGVASEGQQQGGGHVHRVQAGEFTNKLIFMS